MFREEVCSGMGECEEREGRLGHTSVSCVCEEGRGGETCGDEVEEVKECQCGEQGVCVEGVCR